MTAIQFRLSSHCSRVWRWAFCRHGHGVHSPFAYHLVRNVINERHGYYLYEEIRRRRMESACTLRQKDLELLYRLSLHRKPRQITLIGPVSEIEQWVLQQGADRDNPTVERLDPSTLAALATAPDLTPDIDLLYLKTDSSTPPPADFYNTLRPRLRNDSVVIVAGIRQSPRTNRWWNLIRRETSHLSFDLYRFGLLYYAPTLTKGHHRVGY